MVTDTLLTNAKHDPAIKGKLLTLHIDAEAVICGTIATWTSPDGRYRICGNSRKNGKSVPRHYFALVFRTDGFGRQYWMPAIPASGLFADPGTTAKGKPKKQTAALPAEKLMHPTVPLALAALEHCYLEDQIMDSIPELPGLIAAACKKLQTKWGKSKLAAENQLVIPEKAPRKAAAKSKPKPKAAKPKKPAKASKPAKPLKPKRVPKAKVSKKQAPRLAPAPKVPKRKRKAA